MPLNAAGSSWARNFVGYSPAFVLGVATGTPVVALVSGGNIDLEKIAALA